MSARKWIAVPLRDRCAIWAVALLVAAALVPADVHATPVSFLGARTLAPGQQTAYATVGVPDMEFGATWGLNSLTDITPRLRLQFGRGARFGGGGLGLGASIRMHLWQLGGWALALAAEPEVQLHLYSRDHPPVVGEASTQSFAISPLATGLLFDRPINNAVSLTGGVKVPLTFYLAPERVLNVPLIAELGCEVEITRNLYLVTALEGGVDFYGPGGDPGWAPYFRGRIGLGWVR